MYNPCIRSWIVYYSHFYRTRLRPTLIRIDAYVIQWAHRKFKRMRHQSKAVRDWLARLRRATPHLLCAEHDRQLGGASPLSSLMVAKD